MMTSAFGRGSVKKLPGLEAERAKRPLCLHVFLEDWGDFGKVDPDAGDVGILSATWTMRSPCAVPQSASGLVFVPGKFCRDGQVGAAADAGHCAEETLEAGGVGVESGEGLDFAGAPRSGFRPVRMAGGEVTPEW